MTEAHIEAAPQSLIKKETPEAGMAAMQRALDQLAV
jgi:hypothetical protein